MVVELSSAATAGTDYLTPTGNGSETERLRIFLDGNLKLVCNCFIAIDGSALTNVGVGWFYKPCYHLDSWC